MPGSSIEISEVGSARDLMDFIRLPWKIYRRDKNWVPPLISERKAFFDRRHNPFFRSAQVKFFLARKHGRLVGRIASIINYNHLAFHEDGVGFFGFFECIEDYEVAKALFISALMELKKEKLKIMRGPANFSTNYEVGYIVDDFTAPPVVQMPYNPKYYLDFTERFGFKKAKDLLAFKLTKDDQPPERLIRIVEKLGERANVKIRTLNMRRFKHELVTINRIYNSAWSKNWGFIPLPDEEFNFIAKDMKEIVDPELVYIAEVDGQPVGFSVALPNVYQILPYANGRLFPIGLFRLLWHSKIKNKIDSMRIITMGIEHTYQKRGIDNLFYLETIKRGLAKGYKWAEISWVLEDNFLMVRVAEMLGAKRYRTYRLYDLPLQSEKTL